MGVPLYQAKAEFFKTLGHPARIRILELLSERDHAVHELLAAIDIEPSNLSQQLGVLRRTSLAVSRRRITQGMTVESLRLPWTRADAYLSLVFTGEGADSGKAATQSMPIALQMSCNP